MNPHIPGAPIEVLVFIGFALVALFGAIRVVTVRDPFISVLSLLLNFAALGVLYLMLEQPFVAISQILVYASAVIVLFLFVIAYLGDRRELMHHDDRAPWMLPLGVLITLLLGGVIVAVTIISKFPKTQKLEPTSADYSFGSAQAVGEVFLTDYLLVFEVISIALLVAVIGGVVLGLTGRARHERLRKLMHTQSADQLKKSHTAEALKEDRKA